MAACTLIPCNQWRRSAKVNTGIIFHHKMHWFFTKYVSSSILNDFVAYLQDSLADEGCPHHQDLADTLHGDRRGGGGDEGSRD